MPKVKMVDYSQNDYSVKSDWPWWRENGSGVQSASAATEHGLVTMEIYTRDNFTRLEFAHDGRFYTRTWQRAWGKKTAVRLAREFAKQVVTGDE